jgi:voltage-gated potassium channel
VDQAALVTNVVPWVTVGDVGKERAMKRSRLDPIVLTSALIMVIPAFYLVLTGPSADYRHAGSALYGVAALLLGARLLGLDRAGRRFDGLYALDLAIVLGALASAWPTEPVWAAVEWLLRLSYCGAVFIRLVMVASRKVMAHSVLQIVMLAGCLLAVSGAGFLWLEPRVHSYADGLWLAFITGATVGYGDLVPSTAASRVLAVFIVLLGYALFSVVTASIAALLVGEDELRQRRALHTDLRQLRADIAMLRGELHAALTAPASAPQCDAATARPPPDGTS